MSTDVTLYDNPGALMTRATDVAGVCAEIVKRTAQQIQGRKYVRVEGWQSIAAAYGCVASSTHVERIEGGFRAIGELRRADGTLVATAEGFVGEDEATWFGGTVMKYGKETIMPKRSDFAIRAMAQTRAISRVCRTAFAFVVVLIDSNLSTTPAEEMQGVYPDDERPRKGKVIEAEPNAATQAEPRVGGSGITVPTEPAPAASDPIKTRSDTLRELCEQAQYNLIDLLAKAEVSHADEMADDDFKSAVSMLRRRITKRMVDAAGALQP